MDNDYLEYREALHALKGSSTELGAKTLASVCQKGEALKPYDIGGEQIKETAAEIEKTFIRTSAALSNVTRRDIAKQ